MSARANIEAALSATANRHSPGSGATAASHFKDEIAMIDGSSDDLIRRYAKQEVRIAAPAVFESKRPDGDRVTIEKAREGLIVVCPDGLVFVPESPSGHGSRRHSRRATSPSNGSRSCSTGRRSQG